MRGVARIGLIVVGALASSGLSGDGAAQTAARVAGAAGMQAHVDPQSGRLVPERAVPGPPQVPAALPAPREVPAPGGGVMSVVPREYFSRVVATVEADGSVRMDCVVPAQQPAR